MLGSNNINRGRKSHLAQMWEAARTSYTQPMNCRSVVVHSLHCLINFCTILRRGTRNAEWSEWVSGWEGEFRNFPASDFRMGRARKEQRLKDRRYFARALSNVVRAHARRASERRAPRTDFIAPHARACARYLYTI